MYLNKYPLKNVRTSLVYLLPNIFMYTLQTYLAVNKNALYFLTTWNRNQNLQFLTNLTLCTFKIHVSMMEINYFYINIQDLLRCELSALSFLNALSKKCSACSYGAERVPRWRVGSCGFAAISWQRDPVGVVRMWDTSSRLQPLCFMI